LSLPSDYTYGLPLPVAASPDGLSAPSPVEREVVGLFDELRDRLLRYLLCLGLSMHDGEEIIQEVFLLLFQHLRQGKPRQNLRGWVFRVARNLALKQRNLNRCSLQNEIEFNDTLSDQCLDRTPNPEEQLGNHQRQRRLLAVVRALSEQDRCCLFLRAEGLRYREIAKVLGISLGAVAASLARSIERLGRTDGH
jgi:RNA polymerase sigma-70 factor, ECF subfamily